MKEIILSELDAIEAGILKLQGSETAAKRQTDLEIAVLKKQKGDAGRLVDRALGILKALQ
ncbi:MAG: hypothetical protein LBL46_00130 [Rickettsiales bacterium]|nr:hypothetical protein [Rickettsiales bacterium]